MSDEDPQDVADRERLFKHFDANGDGKISAAELAQSLQTLGCVTPEEVKNMMDELDIDGDGFISYDEFRTGQQRPSQGCCQDFLDSPFYFFVSFTTILTSYVV